MLSSFFFVGLKIKIVNLFPMLLKNINTMFHNPSINRLGYHTILDTITLNLIDPQYDPTVFSTRPFFL